MDHADHLPGGLVPECLVMGEVVFTEGGIVLAQPRNPAVPFHIGLLCEDGCVRE